MPVIKTPEGKPIRFDYADSHGIDRMFPDHPLSRLRAALQQVFPGVRFEEGFLALAACQDSPSAAGDG
jgi:hypothetical protein